VALDQAGLYAKARAALENTVSLDPGHLRGHIRLAHIYEFEQDYEEAVTAYQKAIDIAKAKGLSTSDLHRDYGRLLAKLGDQENALTHLKLAVRQDPGGALAWYEMGRVALQLERLAEAEEALLRSLDLDESIVRAHYFLGRIYRKLKDQDKAEHHWGLFQTMKEREHRDR